MQYINPIQILELSNTIDAIGIDTEIIKKAKRKLIADIDLSDNGYFEYYGLQLTKGECEKAIDELANNDLKEFYLYLASNKKLNSFLVNGNDEVFTNFKQDSIFKLPEFIEFISPYFAPKFDKALLTAFENENVEQTKAILNTSSLIFQANINTAYKSVSNNIQNKISEIDEITKDIKNEESVYDENDIEDVIDLVKKHFPSKTINCLPLYFQSQILKIAKSINFLQLSIWDAFDNSQVPNDLLEHLLTLNIGGLDKPTFESNYKIVKKKNDERILQAKNAPLLKKWATMLLELRKFIKEVENNTTTSNLAYENLKNLFSISELNSLPTFADDIRTQIGYSIRSLSISIWNKQSDIKSALATINLALQINLDEEAKEKFKQDQTELYELEKKYRGVLVCHFCDKNSPDDNSSISKIIYKETYRTYFPRRVQFSESTITLPRCKKCRETHANGSSQYSMYFFGSLILGVIIGAVTEDSHFIIGGIIGGVVGWLIGTTIEGNSVSKEGIKDTSESTLRNHPLLVERMKQGWTFSKPSA
ncbi:hypothetical protein FLA105534_04297 [Flavobacterium bizetiae]|uniref:Uncharacterized protein n=1 Tax=Flavobacterium bizetiae TaxID=2704140 RepID=A0A6J4GUD6_9FLAO|nr:hypothetical protein [Flavobacterium bizetiae]CAA9202881.1 hypothetical protein FLA105534_04297 [Flavobacterium bizetiae]CAD5343564.1 hypothetical protein FLA105535_03563 [Flavobacterium bizetiae]CAD5349558.1 hypothetical protein FLA105534_03543 [Flavobacterium bizetiae]